MAGRPSHKRSLDAWINGRFVGKWRIDPHGSSSFQYDRAWTDSPEGRPLSLSLPFVIGNPPIKGPVVDSYFDNLLPDSDAIRRRLQLRFRTGSESAFDLLAAIGRDCAGAVQILPEGQEPGDIHKIEVEPLDDARIEHLLHIAASTPRHGWEEHEVLRISIAGAQEKTAFTWHQGRWCRPLGATPTTHIFKLPLGLVGHRQADMRTSIENEWLCAKLLRAYGLEVANCEIGVFGKKKALIVERFDRRLAASGAYWLRLPQEDFCQATGTPASAKYEAEGGPGLVEISTILQNSLSRERDLETLLQAQLIFWMLAATDGHAKNFSIHLMPGARYRLTPLYDVLSVWPITGVGPNLLDYRKLKLAMAVRGKNVHYDIPEIHRRHFDETAAKCGLGADMEAVIDDVVAKTPGVIETVGSDLPAGFPEDVFETISRGLARQAAQLDRERA
jgi:serine/threonine-protein kinase HipA